MSEAIEVMKPGTVCIDLSKRHCPIVVFIKVNPDDARYAMVIDADELDVYNIPHEELERYDGKL